MPDARRWFFDTVVLSNFALAQRLDIVIRRYGRRAHIPQEVLAEISNGIAAGYAPLQGVEEAVAERRLTAAKPLTAGERTDYRQLLRSLSSGEAACIACARSRGGIVATDDRAARAGAGEHGVPVTGTVGILKASCLDASLTADDADTVLADMVRAGFYSPVARISDLLP